MLLQVVKQWGKSNATTTTTFPIAFTTLTYNVQAIEIENNVNETNCYIIDITLLTMKVARYNGSSQKVNWCAIGVQQWGNITIAVNDGTVTFPIAYVTSTYFATADPMDDANYHTNNVAIYNRTNKSFDFDFYQGHIIRAWFAIGY